MQAQKSARFDPGALIWLRGQDLPRSSGNRSTGSIAFPPHPSGYEPDALILRRQQPMQAEQQRPFQSSIRAWDAEPHKKAPGLIRAL